MLPRFRFLVPPKWHIFLGWTQQSLHWMMGKSVGKLWRPSNHFYLVKSHVFSWISLQSIEITIFPILAQVKSPLFPRLNCLNMSKLLSKPWFNMVQQLQLAPVTGHVMSRPRPKSMVSLWRSQARSPRRRTRGGGAHETHRLPIEPLKIP